MGNLAPALRRIYGRLFEEFSPQRWWPAGSRFEVMVGAILTQSAAWGNVEKAVANLKAAGALSPEAIRALPDEALARLIRPSGYYNAKAKKLKALAGWLGGYADSLEDAFDKDAPALRKELLSVHGIGPETADSILLYAAGKPVFVIDAYTRRILTRLGLISGKESYDALQRLFTSNLPADAQMFNEYHALLVRLGKECGRRAYCARCCLKELCRAPVEA